MAENKIAYLPQGESDYRDGLPTYKDYMFMASKIKMRAQSILTFERLEQMLMSGSADNAIRLLAEAGWPNLQDMSTGEIDTVLNERRRALFREFFFIVPEDAVLDVFRMKYDYHNAKSIVKGKAAGSNADALFSDAGRIPAQKLKEAYEDNDYRFVPPALGKAMREAGAVLARTRNPQLADILLDKAYFAEMKELAETVEPNTEIPSPLLDPEALDPFMLRYRALLADAANLRTCVRCVRMGKDAEFLRTALIPDGSVSADCLAQSAFSAEGLTPLFTATPLSAAAALGMTAMKGGTMTRFEKELDDGILRYLANLRLMYFGPELLVWYLSVEETNIVDVRMILTGLKAGIAPERLKERLRETYV